jgi:hypothetical protein
LLIVPDNQRGLVVNGVIGPHHLIKIILREYQFLAGGGDLRTCSEHLDKNNPLRLLSRERLFRVKYVIFHLLEDGC